MNKQVILHLSDLHISKFTSNYNEKLYESWCESENYIDIFIRKIEQIIHKEKNGIHWLIITGDLSNTANKTEYPKVKQFLDLLVDKLNIHKDNIILIPGNHDIYRSKVLFAFEDNTSNKRNPSDFFEEKLESYKMFYNEFYEDDLFDCFSTICNYKVDSNKDIIFLGINTLYKESHQRIDHYGWVNKDGLKEEIEKIKEKYLNFDDMKKIVLFHHPPERHEVSGDAIIKNWKEIKTILDDYNIEIYVFGHIHSTIIDEKDNKIYLGAGSFALRSIDITNSFSIYNIDDTEIIAREYVFNPNPIGTSGIGDWSKEPNKEKIIKFSICNAPKETIQANCEESNVGISPFNDEYKCEERDVERQVSEVTKKTSKDNVDSYIKHEKGHEKKEEKTKEEKYVSNILMKKIMEEKLFKSGHFHWGDNLKAHGWLNTNKFLSKFKNVQLCINAILYYISNKNIKVDTIIGIGMEGNIIGSMLATRLGINYTYVPSKEYSEYEENVKLCNCNKVLFITDTIFTGNTISKIINRYETQLKDISDKLLLSIFCVGNKEEIGKKVQNVTIHSLCDEIQIELCNQESQECPISKYKLDIVHNL